MVSAYFHASSSPSTLCSLSVLLSAAMRVYFGVSSLTSQSLQRGICTGSRWLITARLRWRKTVKNHKGMGECGREDPDAEARGWCHPSPKNPPCMWLTHRQPMLASRPPLVTAKARLPVKHRVCDAWELTTELGALSAEPDQNQLGPCTLAEKP